MALATGRGSLRMLADAEPLRNLRNRIASLRDLTHSVALKVFAEIRFAHDALLASKLGKKASTNLGAIQNDLRTPYNR